MFFKIFTLAIKGLFKADWGVLGLPLVWVCVALIGPNVVAQVYLMNMCLGSGSTNFVVPAYTAFNVVMVALVGGVVYKDFEGMSTKDLVLFFGSIGICLSGLVVISLGQANKVMEVEDEMEDSPNAIGMHTLSQMASTNATTNKDEPSSPAERSSSVSIPIPRPRPRSRGAQDTVSCKSMSKARGASISSVTYQVWSQVRQSASPSLSSLNDLPQTSMLNSCVLSGFLRSGDLPSGCCTSGDLPAGSGQSSGRWKGLVGRGGYLLAARSMVLLGAQWLSRSVKRSLRAQLGAPLARAFQKDISLIFFSFYFWFIYMLHMPTPLTSRQT